MSKIIINNTTSPLDISDVGVTLAASSQMTIPQTEYSLWSTSSDLITMVGNSDIIINDGSFDLSISDGIDLIKGLFNKKTTITSIPDPGGFSFDGTRTHTGSATNETVTVDHVIQSERYLTGVTVKGFGTHWQDSAKFSIVIPVGHAFNPTQAEIVANVFARSWAVSDDTQQISVYKARLYADMILRVEYTTTSATQVNFWVNTFLHEKV